jgi:hypothetical protein
MYKRHTNFAMESVRLEFENTSLSFPLTGGPSTFRCKVKRVTDLLHDCYFCFDIPDIWSPLYSSTGTPRNGAPGYEFQWIENIGYNCIESAGVYINGVKIVETTGEWFKLYSHLTYDATKRAIIDRMVGNLPEINDPQNSFGRMYQYPHAVKVLKLGVPDIPVEPSIRGRQIVVPLHFWFCENPGFALPLIALQGGEVEIRVTLRPVYQLFTIQDVKALYDGGRVAGDPVNYNINTFLSPPDVNGTPTNLNITNWFPDPYIEANYVYLTEGERAQISAADQSFMIREVRHVSKTTQYGPCDMELPMHNMVSRVVWVAQRSDRYRYNDYDNYTNWQNRNRRPMANLLGGYTNPYLQLTSGELVPQSRAQRDIVLESTILLDAKERLTPKNAEYFSLIQHCKHTVGDITPLPGVYMYSFSMNHDAVQPSGGLNGSLINKVILRSTLIQPVPIAITNQTVLPTTVCVYKSTVFNPNPTPVPANLAVNTSDVITIITRGAENVIYDYTYTITGYVESYNVLRIVSGLANLVFAS